MNFGLKDSSLRGDRRFWQTTLHGPSGFSSGCLLQCVGLEVHRIGRALVQCLVRSSGVVQVINSTPIVPSPEKSCISGIRGLVVSSGFIRRA
jgi:hypothetical protein